MKSLEIKNYKNLKDFKIDSLSRVNLIVGKNNVGKSTLLEAISIFAAGGDINWLKEILDVRGESTYRIDDPVLLAERFVSFYSNRDVSTFYKSPIQINSEYKFGLFNINESLKMNFIKFIRIRKTDENGIVQIDTKIVNIDNQSDFIDANATDGLLLNFGDKKTIYSFDNVRSVRRGYNKVIPFEYVRTSEITSSKNPSLFDKITLSPLEKEIISTLHIIEPRIEAINFLKEENSPGYIKEDNRIPIVVFYGSIERYRLSTMGDGINRILTIILALLNCKDGILLIDEFENGLHYSVQTQLWQIIYKLAEELNVQVFATTHSEDCIKSFVTADSAQAGKIIRLENRDGNIVPVLFNDNERLQFAIDQNIEIR